MKNPGFLTNGTIVIAKPECDGEPNRLAVIVGRYEHVVEGFPEYVALPVILNPTETDIIASITSNKSLKSYFSLFEDEIVLKAGIVNGIDRVEWVIVNTINKDLEEKGSAGENNRKIKKFENTLEEAFIEKNFVKFKWIINSGEVDEYTANEWIQKIRNNKNFYLEYFEIKDKDIEMCLTKLEKIK